MSLTWGGPPPAPRLRRLMLDDAPRAAELTAAVGWAHTAEGWARVINWAGRCAFCLVQGDDLIATATGIGYGRDRAWVGMVIVHPAHQRRGYGEQVTMAVVDFLQAQGVERILLDASALGRPLYERLGFRALYRIGVWTGRASSYLGSRARPLREADLDEVIALDADVFGAARGRVIHQLLRDYPALGWVDGDAGAIEGFLLAQTRGDGHAHIGPWAHRTPWGAEKLLRTALSVLIGREVRVNIPDNNAAAISLGAKHDLKRQRYCTRMIYGDAPPPAGRPLDQYGIASMATG